MSGFLGFSYHDLSLLTTMLFFRLTAGVSFSSVEHSRGQRVRLDLKDLDHFSLFPGQVNKPNLMLYALSTEVN